MLYVRVKSYGHVGKVSSPNPWADPGFLERGLICIKVWGFALLIVSHFS